MLGIAAIDGEGKFCWELSLLYIHTQQNLRKKQKSIWRVCAVHAW